MGGSKGIGKSIAKELLNKGENVIIVSRNSKSITCNTFCEDSNILLLNYDMSEIDSGFKIKDFLISNNIQIKSLVNCLPGSQSNRIEDFEKKHLISAIESKLYPYIHMVLLLKDSFWGSGSVVNIIGTNWKHPDSNMFINSMVNSAIVNATKNLVVELAEYNVVINNIHPGFVKTERFGMYIEHHSRINNLTEDETINIIKNKIPLKQIGKTEELAKLAVFLIESKYITGQNINFDGSYNNSL
uniref:SDR family oxidoreductase n=1 Tax=Staphylococcus sp. MI 10-1553 TaxID=1912064 RepID=UPI0023B350B8|nr:SDR family oxidoreductase [Staphylococcus sp. MI 10-1553]